MGGRLEADRAMGCGGKTMPEGGLNQICREQLPHPFKRVDRFLHCLRGTTVHEISVNQNACVFQGRCHERSLIDGYPFLDLFQQTVRGSFESCRHGDATGGCQKAAQVRRECLFKADIAPPRNGDASFQ